MRINARLQSEVEDNYQKIKQKFEFKIPNNSIPLT